MRLQRMKADSPAVVIEIQRLRDRDSDLSLPRYMTQGAAGMDVVAAVDEPLELLPGARALVPTGLAMAIPSGYEVQVRPRSGLAVRHGVSVLNAPGTVDSDYRGEVKVILINHGEDTFVVRRGERIAQLVVAAVVQADIQLVSTLADTERGMGGFGHTGG